MHDKNSIVACTSVTMLNNNNNMVPGSSDDHSTQCLPANLAEN